MAGGAEKKATKRRADARKWYTTVACAVTGVYCAVQQLVLDGFSNWLLAGLLLCTVAYTLSVGSIVSAAYAGEDANLSKDVFYITAFVQLLSLYTQKAWYVYIVVPVYGAYKAAGLLYSVLGMFGGGAGGGDDDAGAAEQQFDLSTKAGRRAAKLAEKRANRTKVKYR